MLKLLIVDDEEVTRNGLRKCIPWSSYGFEQIEESDDGMTALSLISTFKPDIIISDIRMPNMTGIEFIKKTLLELPHCKIIFISGYCDKEYLKAAIQLKAISFIEKPINISELKEAVRVAVEEYNSELNKLKQQMDTASKLVSSIELIKQDIAINLAERNPDNDKIKSLLSISGLDMPVHGDYVSVLFKINITADSSLEKLNDLRKKLLESIYTVYINECISYISGIKDGVHIIAHIHLKSGSNLINVKKVTEKVLFEFKEINSLKSDDYLFIGIGEPVKCLENIYLSYQTAFLAIQKLFFLGNARVVIYENTQNNQQVFDENLEFEFEQYLINCDKAIFPFIKNKADEIRKHDSTLIDRIRTQFYKLLLILYKDAENKLLGRYIEDRKKEYLWQKVSSALTLNELLDFLILEIEDYFKMIDEKSTKSRVVYEVIGFIKKNYINSNLTINDISKSLNLTPTYLCKIFKRDTDKTLNDYINECRIEKAKELLEDRAIKLYEIASETGFNDVKYFTRTFKKITGMSPSEFRGKYLA